MWPSPGLDPGLLNWLALGLISLPVIGRLIGIGRALQQCPCRRGSFVISVSRSTGTCRRGVAFLHAQEQVS